MTLARRAITAAMAAAYAVATFAIDLGHDHAAETARAPECSVACHAPGAHLSGHSSPDLAKVRKDCPACQLRLTQAATTPTGRLEPIRGHVGLLSLPSLVVRSTSPSALHVRGPPLSHA